MNSQVEIMSTITQPQPQLQQQPQPFMEQDCQNVKCMEHGLYSPHCVAQYLNNEASSLIVEGKNIPRAIHILVRALELSRWSPKDENDTSTGVPCSCYHCSLDAYLFHGDEDFSKDYNFDNYDINCSNNERRRTRSQRDLQHNQVDLDDEKGFVYRRPLRTSRASVFKNLYLGSTLTVMILFNLALAHQLLGMQIQPVWASFEERMKDMDKALKLYELCIHASSGCNCSDLAALRLKLLVMNNLSQIHKASGYEKKYKKCLEYLLRALMFIKHGHVGGLDRENEILTRREIDFIYRNMQSSSVLLGNEVQAAAA